jgi:hypothetical protein
MMDESEDGVDSKTSVKISAVNVTHAFASSPALTPSAS